MKDGQTRPKSLEVDSESASTKPSTCFGNSTAGSNFSYEKKLEVVIDQLLESYVPPHSAYVILYFVNRSAITKIFKDRAKMLVSKMGFRTHQRTKFELFYGEKDLWFELGYVMSSMHSSNYVFSYNSTKYSPSLDFLLRLFLNLC